MKTGLLRALKLPFTDVKRLAIGSLLLMVPGVSLITGIPAVGYLIRIMRDPQVKVLPQWNMLPQLVLDGLKGFLVSFAWFIPAIIAGMVGFGNLIVDRGLMPVGGFSLFATLVLALFVITAYLVPSALLSFVESKNLKGAFMFRMILSRAFSKRYLIQWLIIVAVALLFNLAVALVAVLLAYLGTFGAVIILIINGVVSFVISVIAFSLLGFLTESNGTKKHKVFK